VKHGKPRQPAKSAGDIFSDILCRAVANER
jgi:hypothetical protein